MRPLLRRLADPERVETIALWLVGLPLAVTVAVCAVQLAWRVHS